MAKKQVTESVLIEFPANDPIDFAIYARKSVEVNSMTHEQATGWKQLFTSLWQSGARLSDGTIVDSMPKTIRWAGEQLHKSYTRAG